MNDDGRWAAEVEGMLMVYARSIRASAGLADDSQLARLLALGYDPGLTLSLSWAHAHEALRLLTADTVRTPEAPN